jgi:hypothetical protein
MHAGGAAAAAAGGAAGAAHVGVPLSGFAYFVCEFLLPVGLDVGDDAALVQHGAARELYDLRQLRVA